VGGEGRKDEAGIDYPQLVRAALLDLVRKVVARAADDGLPGEHHFYLTFGTGEDGVELAPRLRARFKDEMTIVLQHQFWNLAVDETGFAVTLRFDGAPERVSVPWAALRSFADPSVGFALQLRAAEAPAEEAPAEEHRPSAPDPSEGRGNVVALDAFRRRSD
jgi:hypothetical protein